MSGRDFGKARQRDLGRRARTDADDVRDLTHAARSRACRVKPQKGPPKKPYKFTCDRCGAGRKVLLDDAGLAALRPIICDCGLEMRLGRTLQ